MNTLSIEEKDLLLIDSKYNNLMVNMDKIKNDKKLIFEELMDYLVKFNFKKFFRARSTFYEEYEEKLKLYKANLYKIAFVYDDLVLNYLGRLVIEERDIKEFFSDFEKAHETYDRKDFVIAVSYLRIVYTYIGALSDPELMGGLGSLSVHPYEYNKRLIKEFKKDKDFLNKICDEDKYYAMKMSKMYYERESKDGETKDINYNEYINYKNERRKGSNNGVTNYTLGHSTHYSFVKKFVEIDDKYSDGLIINLMLNSNFRDIVDSYNRDLINLYYLEDNIMDDNTFETNNATFNTLMKINDLYDFDVNVAINISGRNLPVYFNNYGELIKYYFLDSNVLSFEPFVVDNFPCYMMKYTKYDKKDTVKFFKELVDFNNQHRRMNNLASAC
ncbi:hypothetical protein [Staphylococcus phage vB_StaM_SA1]|nr:hypothetical protein [Staphylococcus phage vB_StaM_SA1]